MQKIARSPLIGHIPKGQGTEMTYAITQNDKKWANETARSLRPFLIEHYQMLREYTNYTSRQGFPDSSNVTGADLLYFHVNGEYRLHITERNPEMELDALATPALNVRDPLTDARPILRFVAPNFHETGTNWRREPHLTTQSSPLFSTYHGVEQLDYLHGFRARSEPTGEQVLDPRPELTDYTWRRSPFFVSELASGGVARWFFLPSIGTMFTMLAAHTDGYRMSIKEYFIGKLNNQEGGQIPRLWKGLVSSPSSEDVNIFGATNEYAPWFQTADGSDYQDIISAAARNDSAYIRLSAAQFNTFFLEWAKAITQHPDYHTMVREDALPLNFDITIFEHAVVASLLLKPKKADDRLIEELLGDKDMPSQGGQTYSSADDMNIYGAVNHWMRLLDTFAPIFGIGQSVRLSEKAGGKRIRSGSKNALDSLKKGQLLYSSGVDASIREAIENGLVDPESPWFVFQSVPITGAKRENEKGTSRHFVGQYGTDDDGAATLYALQEAISEEDLVFMDGGGNIIDEEEGRGLGYARKTRSTTFPVFVRIMLDTYFEMETILQLRQATDVDRRKFTKNQRAQQDEHIGAGLPPQGRKGGNKVPIAEFLIEQRMEYLTGFLMSLRALTKDRNLDDMFSRPFLQIEADWYSGTLAKRLAVAREAEEPESILERREVRALPSEVQQLGLAQSQTVFRRLDSPTLREVISQYLRDYYRFMMRSANFLDGGPAVSKGGDGEKRGKGGKGDKRGKKGGKKKQQKIMLPELWNLLEAAGTQVMSIEGVRLAHIWTAIHQAIDRHREIFGRDKPSTPPSWAGRVYWEDLEADVALYGEQQDVESSITHFREYIQFLQGSYYSDYTLIGTLLSELERTKAFAITDVDDLRNYFLNRLKTDSNATFMSFSKFPAYRTFIFIMRTFLDMPAHQARLAFADQRNDYMISTGIRATDIDPITGQPLITPLPPTGVAEGQTPVDYMGMPDDELVGGRPSVLRPDVARAPAYDEARGFVDPELEAALEAAPDLEELFFPVAEPEEEGG